MGEKPKPQMSASPPHGTHPRAGRPNSASTSVLHTIRRNSPRNAQIHASPYSATNRLTPQYAQPIGNGRRSSVQGVGQAPPPLPPHVSKVVRSSSMAAGTAMWGNTLRANSARGQLAPLPLQRTVSAGYVEKRCKYVVATMKHCGSIYEEMTKQLLASGRWSRVTVRQRSIMKTLFVAETQRDLADSNVHLLLGEKMPCERVISTRRDVAKRFQSRLSDSGNMKRSNYGPRQYASIGIRMPMGNGDDGEARVVDFVENTRAITLKSAMLTNLLKFHYQDWHTLGEYLPMAFKLLPRQPARDDREALLATAKQAANFSSGGDDGACMWIAKSSSGCHGDDIEIFRGDQVGLRKLLRYVDTQRDSQAWIAQQYVDRPLLYHKRKFDIRCWALLLRDKYVVYVHEELVMRTSSVPYNRDTATSKTAVGRLAHITNHCVQETAAAYSLYEEGNELWREHLDGLVRYKAMAKNEKLKHEQFSSGRSPRPHEPNASDISHVTSTSLNSVRDSPYQVRDVKRGEGSASPLPASARGVSSGATLDNYIMPQIHFIVRDTMLAAKAHVPDEPPVPPTHTFQVFGYDFLIDDDLKVWLLEINGAPGGPDRLKPALMKDTIELAVAPFFPGTMNLKTQRHNGYVRVYP